MRLPIGNETIPMGVVVILCVDHALDDPKWWITAALWSACLVAYTYLRWLRD